MTVKYTLKQLFFIDSHLNKKKTLLGRRKNNLSEQTNIKHNILVVLQWRLK